MCGRNQTRGLMSEYFERPRKLSTVTAGYCWSEGSEGLTRPSQWRCHQADAPNITKLFARATKKAKLFLNLNMLNVVYLLQKKNIIFSGNVSREA